MRVAYEAGARRIIIRPGTYFLPDSGPPTFLMKGWRNATISGYGATLISAVSAKGQGSTLFELEGATGITIAGMTASATSAPAYQGKVIAVGRNDAGKFYADWQPSAGYPTPDPLTTKWNFNVVDGGSRYLKLGVGDFYDTAVQPVRSGVYRCQFRDDTENIAVGDWLVARYGDLPRKVHLDNSRDCTIKDVTLLRNGFAPIFETGGGGNHILNCTWKLGPKPEAASEMPLITNSADGFHSTGAHTGPDIEHCTMSGLFLDDCIAIHGTLDDVTAVSGATLTLKRMDNVRAGEPVRISDTKGYFVEAKVMSIDPANKTITLDAALPVPVGAKLSNPLENGAGYKVIGCRLGDTRSRGLLLKADDGLVSDNTIERCGMSAISLGPEFGWGEGDYVRNVHVLSNVLRENGRAFYGGEAILVHGEGAVGNKEIYLVGNHFASSYQGDIRIEWTSAAYLSSNRFAPVRRWPGKPRLLSPVNLDNCHDITFHDNGFDDPALYSPVLTASGANVYQVNISNSVDDGMPSGSPADPPGHTFSYSNPIKFLGDRPQNSLRDPAILRENGVYYLVFTMFPFTNYTDKKTDQPDHGSSPGIALYSSKDLSAWKFENWLVKSSDLPANSPYKHQFWAPELHKLGGRFYLIFGGSNWIDAKYNIDGKMGYYQFVAVSNNVVGPYAHFTALKGPGVDTTLFEDSDGKTYAVWPRTEIHPIDLTHIDEGQITIGPTISTAVHDADFAAIGKPAPDTIEGPFMIKRQRTYYCFFAETYRGPDGFYDTGVATAKSLSGPWHLDPRWRIFPGGHQAIFTGPDRRFWTSYKHEGDPDTAPWLNIDPLDFDAEGNVHVTPTKGPQTVPLRAPKRE